MSFDSEAYAKEELIKKYGLRKGRRGFWKSDVNQAKKTAVKNVTGDLGRNYADQTWNTKKILNAPGKALNKNADLNTVFNRSVRANDWRTVMNRLGLTEDELKDVKLSKVVTRCKDVGGGRRCTSRSVYWHHRVHPNGMCWRCTAKRSV